MFSPFFRASLLSPVPLRSQIGTPLPALTDTKRDTNEYVPVWKQEVRDDQGRRRFHGAFTGGFSAGYYNSVGSKEGECCDEFWVGSRPVQRLRAAHERRVGWCSLRLR